MLDGVILLWFVLTVLALLFVAIDSRSTPASPVLKWGFVLLTAYTGVFGAFLYILGCREPLPGTPPTKRKKSTSSSAAREKAIAAWSTVCSTRQTPSWSTATPPPFSVK